ncbi:SUMF1/EgtB/PvdO family nonheme iron enzyme [uncultured Treponema sp.]|uniref:formylglycine-generating enzyme family protein n=1 Tax=uncultured Treponema sp. TaxID=162155 RepID=UPI0025EE2C99|nr:SUMF1/EgtB/PvdO family nonheme iron enzyme [uncultured Treponema sp.]
MKKSKVFAVLAAMWLAVSGYSEKIPKGFVKIPAVSIDGTEKWTPRSVTFEEGRKFEIASFYMCDHPVTRGEFKAVVGKDPSTAKTHEMNGKNNPVNNVSLYEALTYCNLRSLKENLTPCYLFDGELAPGNVYAKKRRIEIVTCDFSANGYRLPTEAEWEWAARGGESYTYAGSNDINEVAWCTNSLKTRNVKTKKANGYGLYDMCGILWEWCWDSKWVSSDTAISVKDRNRYCWLHGGVSFHDRNFCNLYDENSIYLFGEADYASVADLGYDNGKLSIGRCTFRVVRNAK